MPYATTPSATIHTPPAAGSWNELLYDFVTVVDARPLGTRRTDPDLGLAARMAVEATRPTLEIGLAPRSESNLVAGFDGVEGVFFATWDELEIGAVLEMRIHLPGGSALEVMGRVEWTREPYVTGGPGVGLSFVGLNERHARLLARFASHREPMFHA